MQWNTLKALLMFGLAAFLAICCGISVAVGEYRLMFLAMGVCLFIAMVVFPGYPALLAFAIFCPFAPPLPFIWQFPFVALVLGVCMMKFFVERAISSTVLRSVNTLSFSFALFFGWVALRWCMKPALPNVAGWGQNVTGFRAYLGYGIAFGLVFLLGRFVPTRDDLSKLFRWMTIGALVFMWILIPLIFAKTTFAIALNYLGVFVAYFDNGMLRLVNLPFFGVVAISTSMLPLLFPTTKRRRVFLFLVGWAAVVLGGTRSGLLMALAVFFAILFLKKQWLRFSLFFGIIAMSGLGIYYAGDEFNKLTNVGFLRPLSVISEPLAHNSDAEASWEWRKIRWDRAIEQIRLHPLIGESYGGMENAWIWGEEAGEIQEEQLEMTMATGGVHNGFLDCALALGIPAALLMIYILASRIFISAHRAFALKNSDPFMSQANCFLSANLVALVVSISIGSDVNDKQLWFYLGLTVLAGHLSIKPTRASNPMTSRREEQLVAV